MSQVSQVSQVSACVHSVQSLTTPRHSVTLSRMHAMSLLACFMVISTCAQVFITAIKHKSVRWRLRHTHVARLLLLKRYGDQNAQLLLRRRVLTPPPGGIWSCYYLWQVYQIRHALRSIYRTTQNVSEEYLERLDIDYYSASCHGMSRVDYFLQLSASMQSQDQPIVPYRTRTAYFGVSQDVGPMDATAAERLTLRVLGLCA